MSMTFFSKFLEECDIVLGTIAGKVTAFLANETTVGFFLPVLREV